MKIPLPTFDAPTFPVTLPSTKKTIMFRPFLVKEEKILLIAQESNDPTEQTEAVAQVIRNCSNGLVEPKEAPYFDIEYVLLQLRCRSVGELVTPMYRCQHRLEGNTTCDHITTVRINLSEVSVKNLTTDPTRMVIALPNDHKLTLRYPTIYTIDTMIQFIVNQKSQTEDFMRGLVDMLHFMTAADGTVYNFDDHSEEEKLAFIDMLPHETFEAITAFLSDMPTVKHTITYTCDKCQFEHHIVMSGVADFLV